MESTDRKCALPCVDDVTLDQSRSMGSGSNSTESSSNYSSSSNSDDDDDDNDDDGSGRSAEGNDNSITGREVRYGSFGLNDPSSRGHIFSQLDELLSRRAVPARHISGLVANSGCDSVRRSLREPNSKATLTTLRSDVLSLLSAGRSVPESSLPIVSMKAQSLVRIDPDVGSSQSDPLGLEEGRHVVLGFLIHLKSSDKVLLVIGDTNNQSLPALALRHHAVMEAPGVLRAAAASGRLVATLHLASSSVASTGEYQDWMQTLSGPQIYSGCPESPSLKEKRHGSFVFSSEENTADPAIPDLLKRSTSVSSGLVGPALEMSAYLGEKVNDTDTVDLGFQASARTISRLNLVSLTTIIM